MRQDVGLDQRVGYVLKQVHAQLRSRMEQALRPHGLTVPQYACLEVLREHGALSSAELARASFVSRQSMNVMLTTMSRNGWVEPSPEPTRGRARPYYITSRGHEVLAPASKAIQAVELQLVDGMDHADQQALLRLLSGCLDRLA